MDEQPRSNDIFTIRPLEWLPFRHYENWFTSKTTESGCCSVILHGPGKWSASCRGAKVEDYPTKEAAMAACEQHWRSEIEPALVRVEDGRDALLWRALRALRLGLYEEETIHNEETGFIEDRLATMSEIAAEIEKALSAKEASV
jgi:hypothetical protein